MNQPLSHLILEKYQVRKTQKQKDAFINLLRAHYPDLLVEEGGFPRHRNLILGDLEQANVVFTAHYDTCALSLFPNIIMPYRKGLRMAYTFAALLPILIPTVALILGLRLFGAGQAVTVAAGIGLYYALYFGKFFGGIPNPHTANDNTSGILTLLEIYERAKAQRAAFVFFDNEEIGCAGSAWFHKQHKSLMENKLLVNFDCVGDGKEFLLVTSEDVPMNAITNAFAGENVHFDTAKNANHSSDHKHFKQFCSVLAVTPSKNLGLHTGRIHTPRDTVLDMDNITYLAECALRLLAEMER